MKFVKFNVWTIRMEGRLTIPVVEEVGSVFRATQECRPAHPGIGRTYAIREWDDSEAVVTLLELNADSVVVQYHQQARGNRFSTEPCEEVHRLHREHFIHGLHAAECHGDGDV